MTDITLEQRARELLAAECKKPCSYDEAHIPTRHAHAAIKAALRLSAGANAVEQLNESEKNVALGQAVKFAEYVERQAKGGMRDAAKNFLSLPYAQKIAARLARAPEED